MLMKTNSNRMGGSGEGAPQTPWPQLLCLARSSPGLTPIEDMTISDANIQLYWFSLLSHISQIPARCTTELVRWSEGCRQYLQKPRFQHIESTSNSLQRQTTDHPTMEQNTGKSDGWEQLVDISICKEKHTSLLRDALQSAHLACFNLQRNLQAFYFYLALSISVFCFLKLQLIGITRCNGVTLSRLQCWDILFCLHELVWPFLPYRSVVILRLKET